MKRIFIIVIALLVAQMLFALIAGPHSCEWGNTAYTVTGILIILISVILVLTHRPSPITRRIGFAFLTLLVAIVFWIGGFLAGDFRILCKLF